MLWLADVPSFSNRDDRLSNIPPKTPVPDRAGDNREVSYEEDGVRVVERVDMPEASELVRLLELPAGVRDDSTIRYFSISYEVDRLPVDSLLLVDPSIVKS